MSFSFGSVSSMSCINIVLYVLCACFVATLIIAKRRNTPATPFPPGPPADPLIGHLRVFSPARQLNLFKKWAAEYGDIFHLNILGQTLVVVNSVHVAADLLDKRSANYSDRPRCTTLELLGWKAALPILPYGPRWRQHRKMFQEYFSPEKCLTYREDQARAAHILLKALLDSPRDFGTHTETFAMSSLIEIAYGHKVEPANDAYIRLAERAIHIAEEIAAGVSLLDLFPSLQHVPHWIPGISSLTAIVQRYLPDVMNLQDYPLDDVKKQMDAGVALPSFLAAHLEHLDLEEASHDELEDIRVAAATILIAGAETTWSSIQMFFFAMLLFPEAQRKAQEEIDRMVGPARLPDLSDREHLPFVDCLLQETMRWRPVAPSGVPHRSVNDDVYNGMFIPKGSLIIPNVMAMSRDERVYKDVQRFYPERFLPAPAGYGEPHFSDTLFGFGRRICPGRYFADNAMWLVMVTFLATFNVRKAIGSDGKMIEPLVEFTTGGSVSRPKRIDCAIEPRSEQAKSLIRQHAD